MKRFPIDIICFVLLVSGLNACRTIEEGELASKKMTQSEFAAADSDSDGQLTKKELATYLHREALAEFDLDGDSQISSKEWAAARPSAGGEDPAFQQMDRNSNNLVTTEEATEFLVANESFSNAFDELDDDQDGSLIWEEVEAGDPETLEIPIFPSPSGS